MVFAILMFVALEIDRSNITQALADNFLVDLNITTDGWLPALFIGPGYAVQPC